MTDSLMTRRRFFQALAASALAAGVPLPVGLARAEVVVWVQRPSFLDEPGLITEYYFVSKFVNSGVVAELTETIVPPSPRRLSSDAQAAV